jgi:uncharacterized membrane protein
LGAFQEKRRGVSKAEEVEEKMNGYMGFDEWFVFITALVGAITGYCLFSLRRWDVAFALFLVWFCLSIGFRTESLKIGKRRCLVNEVACVCVV